MHADIIHDVYDDTQLNDYRYAAALRTEYLHDGFVTTPKVVLIHDYRNGFINPRRFYL